MESKTLRDSDLVTHQPCHIPGYAGWCRNLPNKFGGTFGRLTHETLTDSNPDTLVLARMWPQHDDREMNKQVAKDRENRGEIIYNDIMIPGYTGRVPTLFEKYGRCYRDACNDAISDFENCQKRVAWKNVTPENTKYKLPPLKSVCKEADPFFSKDLVGPPNSPYYMQPNDPLRHFVSGYGGFVPQRRYLIGSPYAIETSRALNSFDKLQGTHAFNAGRNVTISDDCIARPPMMSDIYRENAGLIPRYTGHVPGGYKSRKHAFSNGVGSRLAVSNAFYSITLEQGYRSLYGKTFGAATTNALKKGGIDYKVRCVK